MYELILIFRGNSCSRQGRDEAPLLVQAVVVGPLDHLRARVCLSTGDIRYQITIAVHDFKRAERN